MEREAFPDPCQERGALLMAQHAWDSSCVFYERDWKGWTLDDSMHLSDRYLSWFRNERIKIALSNRSPKEHRTELVVIFMK
ncbi:MAG: hypothetical protein SPJ34_06695 [Candidatus Ornithospirochaeta sp.]|nr:hypothetical protein [Candidatus Ornithospirochaeta sp.]